MKYLVALLFLAFAFQWGHMAGTRQAETKAEEVKALRLLEVRDSVSKRYQEVYGRPEHVEAQNVYDYVVYGDVPLMYRVVRYDITSK